jgi:hypothetical protein
MELACTCSRKPNLWSTPSRTLLRDILDIRSSEHRIVVSAKIVEYYQREGHPVHAYKQKTYTLQEFQSTSFKDTKTSVTGKQRVTQLIEDLEEKAQRKKELQRSCISFTWVLSIAGGCVSGFQCWPFLLSRHVLAGDAVGDELW